MNFTHILEAIKKHETIIIHRHVRPDPDAYGSQAGLRELIQHTFPEKRVLVVGEEEPSLTFLTGMDHVQDSVYEDALVIVCDTANTARIDDARYDEGSMLIKIDHHPNVDPYGDLQWIDTDASSTSEMIYELYQYAKTSGYQLNDEAARLLYAGIVGDTGRFLFPSATTKTFQYASELVAYSFDRPALYDGIYRMPKNIARLKGYILQTITVSESGVSSVSLTKDQLNEFGVTATETSQLVGTLGDVEGIQAWVMFIEEDDVIRVRLRSKGPVINTIAAKYDGGGHPMAAGATISKWHEREYVLADLEEACQNV